MPRPQHRTPKTRTHAAERIAVQRAANLRLIRTVILGTIAVAVAIIWLGDQYGIEREETLQYLLAAVLFVATLGALGFLGFGCLWIFRTWSQRRRAARANEDLERNDPP